MPSKIRIENLEGIGLIDVECPEISWFYSGAGNFQKKCRTIVYQSDIPIWDSGFRLTSHTRMKIEQPLQSRTVYTAKVTTVDEYGEEETDSLSFETGLLRERDEDISRHWEALWIGGGTMLRRQFTAGKTTKARAYVTGLGYFEMYLNGKKVGDDVLSPSYTSYHKRVEYMAYDISDRIQTGENTVCIILGRHWPQRENNPASWARYYHGEPCALLQIDLFLADNTIATVTSGSSFKVTDSPITKKRYLLWRGL